MADVRVVHSDGTTGSVPEAKLQGALKAGWHIETPEEHAERTQGGNLIATAAESAAAGAINMATAPVRLANRAVTAATGVDLGKKATGLVDRLAGGTGKEVDLDTATGGRETLENLAAIGGGEQYAQEYAQNARERAIANPNTALAGNIAGQIGAAALSGGTSVLAGAGKSIASRLAAGGLGNVASKAAGGLVTGALEGALQGAAQANEDAYIENKPQTAERVLASVGISSLLGGALGGTLGAAMGKFENRAAQKALFGATKGAEEGELEAVGSGMLGGEPPAPGLGKAMREIATTEPPGRITSTYNELASKFSGVDRETIEKFGPSKVISGDEAANTAWRELEEHPQLIEKATGDLTEAARALRTESSDVFQEVINGELKRDNVARLIKDIDKGAALNAIREQATTLRKTLGALQDAETFGDLKWARGALKYSNDALDDVMSGALGAEDSYLALDNTKRQLQKITIKARESAKANAFDQLKRDQLFATADLTGEAAESARQHLADATFWGKQGEAQERVNKAWQAYLNSKGIADQALLTRVGTDYHTGNATYEVDPAKMSSFVDGLGTQKSSLKEGYVRAHLEATKNLVNEISDAYELAPKHAERVTAVRDAYGNIERVLRETGDRVKRNNQLLAMMEAEKNGAAALFGGNSVLQGSILGGPLGAAGGMIANATMRPLQAARAAAKLRALASNTTKATESALGKFFGHASHSATALGKATAATARAVPAVGKRAVVGLGSPQLASGDGHRERVARLAADPQLLTAEVHRLVGDSAKHLPQMGVALSAVPMRAVQFLASKLPPAAPPNALDGSQKAPISPVDQDRFNDYVRGATEPMSLLDDLQSGMLSPDVVEAVKTVYPQFYDDLRASVFDYVTQAAQNKQPLAYQKRVTLDMAFGGNGAIEPSLAPDYMRAIQQAAAASMPPPKAPGGARRGTKAPNIAEHHQSGLDRLTI